MNKRLLINTWLCDGCGLCELVCAFSHTGLWHPALSRIKVLEDKKNGLFFPTTCAHCVNPPCANACLMNVIVKDPETGLTIRNESSCIGCRACEISCPFNVCLFDYVNEVVVNCDLCKGDPLCVKVCPTGAIEFVSVEETPERKRVAAASDRLLESAQR